MANLSANSGSSLHRDGIGRSSGTGIIGGARAQATGLPVDRAADYFNLAAFAVPASGTYGNAGRNTIPGIPNFSMNASVFRTFRFKERHTHDVHDQCDQSAQPSERDRLRNGHRLHQCGAALGARPACGRVTAQLRFNY